MCLAGAHSIFCSQGSAFKAYSDSVPWSFCNAVGTFSSLDATVVFWKFLSVSNSLLGFRDHVPTHPAPFPPHQERNEWGPPLRDRAARKWNEEDRLSHLPFITKCGFRAKRRASQMD